MRGPLMSFSKQRLKTGGVARPESSKGVAVDSDVQTNTPFADSERATQNKYRWNPPPMPVVLRIPRIIDEIPALPKKESRRSEFRWRVGVGAAMLMLVAALPWLVRWHPPADSSQEVLIAAIQAQDESGIEVLPTLYARATSGSAASLENENGIAEILDALVVPAPAGGPQ